MVSGFVVFLGCEPLELVAFLSQEETSSLLPRFSVIGAFSNALAESTRAMPVVLLAYLENPFGARQLQGVWVVDLVTVQLLHLSFRYEAALVAESLFG